MAIKSDFIKGVYSASQLNLVTGCFISCGVIGEDDLKVTYKDGTAVVGEGKCVAPDKAVLTVDKGGYKIPAQITDGYIYIDGGEIKWGDSPDDGSLLLARITNGKCYDERKRAYIYTNEAGEE